MKMIRVVVPLLVGMTVLTSDALAQRRKPAGAAANGEMLAQSCFACHGSKGASVAGPMPTIGGQSDVYLTSVLKSYRAGRSSTIMSRLMKAYSEEEIQAIAKYLAEQPYVRAEQPVDAGKVEAGLKGYQKACKDCHPKGGRESSEPDYPLLAGQWLGFLQASLSDIHAGTRVVDEKFNSALQKLSKDELEAVLHYFAAQR